MLKIHRHNFAKNWSNIGRKLIKKLVKNEPKIGQKVVPNLFQKVFCLKFKKSGEDDDEEEEED
jgi:hypothetical protein